MNSVFPTEIFLEIFSFFNAKTLEGVRLICKKWNKVILNNPILYKNLTLKITPNLDLELYNNKYKEAFKDQIKRKPNIVQAIGTSKDQKLYIYNIHPNNVEKTKISDEKYQYLTPSPNGLLCVACILNTLEVKDDSDDFHIFTLNSPSENNLIIKIKSDNFKPFYFYWSPNSKYLSWIGNYEEEIGLFVLNVNEIIKKNPKDNCLEFLEKNGPVIINDLSKYILKGRPLFYCWLNERIYFHLSRDRIGYIDNLKDINDIKIKSKLAKYGAPVVIKSGNMIAMIENDLNYECVLISTKGEILKKFFILDKEKTPEPVFNLILSPNETLFALGISNSNGITYSIMMYDLIKNQDRKIPSNLFLIYLFNDQEKLIVLTFNMLKMYTMTDSFDIQKYSIKGLTHDFGMVIQFFDQYLHSSRFYSKNYFLFGSHSTATQPHFFVKNVEEKEKEIILDEGNFACFIPK